MRPSLILLDMMMPEMDGWLLRQELKKSPDLASIPIVILSGARRRARRRAGAGRGRLPAQAAAHRQPARDRRALLPPRLPQLEPPRCELSNLLACAAVAGPWSRSRGRWPPPRAARADDRRRRRRGRARRCPRRRCRPRAGSRCETPHFELHFYPEEREFAERAARVAERAYRLITRYLNWRAERARQPAAHRSRPTARTAGAARSPTTSSTRYGAPPDGMDELSDFDDFVKLLHHARVHPRRAPGHDPELVPAAASTRCWARSTRPTCRSRPGSSKGSRC